MKYKRLLKTTMKNCTIISIKKMQTNGTELRVQKSITVNTHGECLTRTPKNIHGKSTWVSLINDVGKSGFHMQRNKMCIPILCQWEGEDLNLRIDTTKSLENQHKGKMV